MKKKLGQKTHRWGPIIETGFGSLMTRCLKFDCDMDLSVDMVPAEDYPDASAFLEANKSNADKSFPCPFKKSSVYERLVVD